MLNTLFGLEPRNTYGTGTQRNVSFEIVHSLLWNGGGTTELEDLFRIFGSGSAFPLVPDQSYLAVAICCLSHTMTVVQFISSSCTQLPSALLTYIYILDKIRSGAKPLNTFEKNANMSEACAFAATSHRTFPAQPPQERLGPRAQSPGSSHRRLRRG